MTKFGILKYTFLVFAVITAFIIGGSFIFKKKLGKFSWVSTGVVLLGILFFFNIYIVEPNWLSIENVTIHDAPLYETLQNATVVQITDIHLRGGIGKREKSMIGKINALNPDFIFITGDFLDAPDQLESIRYIIHHLKAKIGIWGVVGNTDLFSFKSRELAEKLSSAGIRILINESQAVHLENGRTLWIAGLDDPITGKARLDTALESIPPSGPVILLSHGPNIFPKAAEKNVNLVLAGHLHGGQVGIPLLVHLSRYANRGIYICGLYKRGNSQMYLNRGIGTKTLPIRFLCRPEITVFHFKP